MAKKKFTAGLESVFDIGMEEKFEEGKGFNNVVEKEAPKRSKRRSSRKNFTSNLDSLFQEALEESVQEHVQKAQKKPSFKERKEKSNARIKRTLSGLDALIRQTTDGNINLEISKKETSTKRVTFTLNKARFSKLKEIAREEKAFIKDIMGDLIAQYIKKYEND